MIGSPSIPVGRRVLTVEELEQHVSPREAPLRPPPGIRMPQLPPHPLMGHNQPMGMPVCIHCHGNRIVMLSFVASIYDEKGTSPSEISDVHETASPHVSSSPSSCPSTTSKLSSSPSTPSTAIQVATTATCKPLSCDTLLISHDLLYRVMFQCVGAGGVNTWGR